MSLTFAPPEIANTSPAALSRTLAKASSSFATKTPEHSSGKPISHHRAVRTVCSAERVTAEGIVQLCKWTIGKPSLPQIFLDRTRSAWVIVCASRRWWNSWCMCRLSCLILPSSSLLPSRSSTFQFPGGDGGRGRGGLQGSLSRQNSAALHVEQTVDIPVPGRAGEGGRGGLPGFAGQGSTASSSHVGAADGAGQGVFRTFHRKKKVRRLGPHSGSELSADFNPSTLSAHQMPPEQLVDVPVPQVPERSSYGQLCRFRNAQVQQLWQDWTSQSDVQTT